jgi:3-hydroxybutyrate dehydrogenase
MSLKGKVALVTGSTSGIGLGIARALGAEGADLMLNGFGDAAKIETERAGLAKEFGVRVGYSAADISKPADIAAMVAETQKSMGSLDILVNNAGIQFVADVEEFPEDRWNSIIAINLSGVFFGMKAAIPGMKAKGWGRIINIASAHGLVASPQKVAYVAAKHGVVGLTKVAAIEGAPIGITVNAICPGAVMTELIRGQAADLATSFGGGISEDEALDRAFLEAMPTRRFIEPIEVGALCAYLCGDLAKSITGAPISIDGGWFAH